MSNQEKDYDAIEKRWRALRKKLKKTDIDTLYVDDKEIIYERFLDSYRRHVTVKQLYSIAKSLKHEFGIHKFGLYIDKTRDKFIKYTIEREAKRESRSSKRVSSDIKGIFKSAGSGNSSPFHQNVKCNTHMIYIAKK